MAQVDSSMYLQMQAPDIFGGFARGFGQGAQMAQNYQQAQARKAQEQEKKTIGEIMRQNQINKDAYNADPEMHKSPYDENKFLMGQLANANLSPETQMAYEDRLTQRQSNQMKLQGQERAQKAKLVYDAFSTVKDQQSYSKALDYLKSQGMDTKDYTGDYASDRPVIEMSKRKALSISEQLQQANADRTYNLQKQNLDEQRLQRQMQQQGKQKEVSNKMATDLRKERSGLPVTKSTQEVAAAYNRMQNAAKEPSAAGDLSLIFNYMKMLDPRSTVREGEFANAQNAAGVPTKILNTYNNIMSGQRLSAEQRIDFLKNARGSYQAQMDVQNKIDEQYKALAEKNNIPVEDVILMFEANPMDQQLMQQPQQKQSGFFDWMYMNKAYASPQQGPVQQQPQVFKTSDIPWADEQ